MYKTKDYLLGFEIIVNPERSKRPSHFEPPKIDKKTLKEEIKHCPFCPGNEDKTPNEYWRIEKNKEWIIRCFPNKYKIWKWHDLIVDTRDHLKDWNDIDYLHLVFAAIQKRVKELYNIKEVNYVHVFRNYGEKSGASIRHSHLQILGLDFIPEHIDKLKAKLKICSCRICRKKWENELLIKETKNFRVLAIDGRFDYELEIHPKEHKGFLSLDSNELQELAGIVKEIITIIKQYFDSYNVLFFIEPKNSNDFHFFIRIFPRKSLWGGFELSSNIFVNSSGKEKTKELFFPLINK
jgi:UDPglucose--hexose-1-phosphate uridylyltransferase